MAATIPVKVPSTLSLSLSRRKTDTASPPLPPSPSSLNSATASPSRSERVTSSERPGSNSRLFLPHHPRSDQNQVQLPSPPLPQPQENHGRRRSYGFSLYKLSRPFRQGKVFGFLKSHCHIFHRRKTPNPATEKKEPETKAKERHDGRSSPPASSVSSFICFQYPCSKRWSNGTSVPLNRGSHSPMYSEGIVPSVCSQTPHTLTESIVTCTSSKLHTDLRPHPPL